MPKITPETLKEFKDLIEPIYNDIYDYLDKLDFDEYLIRGLYRYRFNYEEIQTTINTISPNKYQETGIISILDPNTPKEKINLDKLLHNTPPEIRDNILNEIGRIFEQPTTGAEAQSIKDRIEKELPRIPDYSDILNDIPETETIDTTIGREYISKLDKDLSKELESIFEDLFPANGGLMAILWASAIATVRGNPNTVIMEGSAGEGKTALMEYVLDFIPEKYIIRLNKATLPALLTHTHTKGSDYLDKKIIYLGDLGSINAWEESEEVRNVIKILQTEGKWSRELTEYIETEGKGSEKIVLREELIGKPTMFYTSVSNLREEQEDDRSIIGTVNLNKSDEIIHRIQHLKNPESNTSRRISKLLKEKIPIVHSIFEGLVNTNESVVMQYKLADFKLAFRDSKRIIDLTELLTLINKDRRDRYGKYILPNESDIKQVITFLNKGSNHKQLSEANLKYLRKIFKEYEQKEFTKKDVLLIKGLKDPFNDKVRNLTDRLLLPAIKHGYIIETDRVGDRGAKYYKIIKEPEITLDTCFIPNPNYDILKQEYGEHEIVKAST